MTASSDKQLGSVYTPSWVVDLILNHLEYQGPTILNKRIMEPSFGDGAFLTEIVKRYIEAAKQEGWPVNRIQKGLETNITGIEIEDSAVTACKNKLDELTQAEAIPSVRWDLHQQNSLRHYKDHGLFDLVVGNPPYVRIHHIPVIERTFIKETFSFCRKGTVDLYMAFMEAGIHLLNKEGKLGFITPNSFMHNGSGRELRRYIRHNHLLETLINFQQYQVFYPHSTYTAITFLSKTHQSPFVSYYTYSSQLDGQGKVDIETFSDEWAFDNPKNLQFLQQATAEGKKVKDYYQLRHGICTLKDQLFFSRYVPSSDEPFIYFHGQPVEREVVRPAVKISTHTEDAAPRWALFPYKEDQGRIVALSETELQERYPHAYRYLLEHKETLLHRNIKGKTKWYEYGRSQGLQDVYKEKLVLRTLFPDHPEAVIHSHQIAPGTVVYAGVYATGAALPYLQQLLQNSTFMRYARLVGKDYRGGYKSLRPKQISEVNTDFFTGRNT